MRAVIFDLGHTLWDFAPTEATRQLNVLRIHERLEAALDGRVPPPAALDRALGATVARWLEEWNGERLEQPPTQRLVGEALGALGIGLKDGLLRELTAILFGRELDVPVVEPDTLSALGALEERGLAMGCVTNTITLEDGIRDILLRLGLARYLRSMVASSAMGYRKPHPSLFQRALAELDVPPQEAVFVGDRLVDDIAGAQSVGMRAVLTQQYRQETTDGTSVTPDGIIRRLGELPQAIEHLADGA